MKYLTKDGQEFATLKEAKAHERSLKATPGARSLDAIPADLVADAFGDLNGPLARQLVTLGSQIRAKRKALGLHFRKR